MRQVAQYVQELYIVESQWTIKWRQRHKQEMRVSSLRSLFAALEKGMATHSSILAWKIPWTEEPGRRGLKELDMTEQLPLCNIRYTEFYKSP